MVARLDNFPVVDDDYLVSISDRAQAVGDDDDGLATIERIEVLHDGPLVIGIKGVGGLVKEDIIGILVHRTGDEDALPLPLAQPHAVTSYLRVVLQWQRHHIVVDARYPSGLQQSFLVDVAVVNSDVAGDCTSSHSRRGSGTTVDINLCFSEHLTGHPSHLFKPRLYFCTAMLFTLNTQIMPKTIGDTYANCQIVVSVGKSHVHIIIRTTCSANLAGK